MCPVYINRIASIHAESRNEKPYFSAQEPDYKEMITNANLRRRMSRMIKMGVACGLECLKDIPSEKVRHYHRYRTGLSGRYGKVYERLDGQPGTDAQSHRFHSVHL